MDTAITKMPTGPGAVGIREVADNWRKMSFTALRAMMQTQPLDTFPKNTVSVYKDPRKKLLRKGAIEESLVVDFETTVNGEYQSGCLSIPRRFEEQVFCQNGGTLLW